MNHPAKSGAVSPGTPARDWPGAVFNPADPSHFMVVKPHAGRVRAWWGKHLLCDTVKAVLVQEVGSSFYLPRYYFPLDEIQPPLEPLARRTICPLKGEAQYFALEGEEIGWVYHTFDFASVLERRISFWDAQLTIELSPPRSPNS